MNDRRSKDRLLSDLFPEAGMDDVMLAQARRSARKVRRQRALRVALPCLTMLLLAVGWWHLRSRDFGAPVLPAVVAARPAYDVIDDKELLSLLKDEQVLVLPDTSGGRQVVWLDPNSRVNAIKPQPQALH